MVYDVGPVGPTLPPAPVHVRDVVVGDGALTLIAGPCVLEAADRVLRIAEGTSRAAATRHLSYVFKASWDKANRTSARSARGPGLDEGLRLLERVRDAVGCPVTTDVHEVAQVAAVAQVADLLQVPAFLCRQTDLLVACGATGLPVNVKKGQFLAPADARYAADKVRAGGAGGVLLTERGTTFGYGDLVVDVRGLPVLRALAPVVFDGTHSAQRPGAGGATGGDRSVIPALCRAAVAVGVDALFLEVHDDPAAATSDAATQWPLGELGALLDSLLPLHAALRQNGSA
jgi:2-dehydro-3-deoxyphosphooctonate aldolase (KDO 8-P synthase)